MDLHSLLPSNKKKPELPSTGWIGQAPSDPIGWAHLSIGTPRQLEPAMLHLFSVVHVRTTKLGAINRGHVLLLP
jgi:hypothetical protein